MDGCASDKQADGLLTVVLLGCLLPIFAIFCPEQVGKPIHILATDSLRCVQFFIQDGSTNTDDDSSSSALINAADEEPSECFVDAEERLQIAADGRAWGASKMLCCFTSGGSQFQSLGSPKFGSMLWQSTGGFKFLTRTLSGALLPPIATDLQGRLTVVLDLDGAQPPSNCTTSSDGRYFPDVLQACHVDVLHLGEFVPRFTAYAQQLHVQHVLVKYDAKGLTAR